jgi:hypothetical protein
MLKKFLFAIVSLRLAGNMWAAPQEVEPRVYQPGGSMWETTRVPFCVEVILGRDGLPIGTSFSLAGHGRTPEPEPLGPWQCGFRSVGWALCENFGYSVRFILGPDRGLVGVSFRIWNNSRTNPLVLVRKPGSLPFLCDISQSGGPDFPRRNQGGFVDLGRLQEMVEWTLAPRAREYFFVPIRDLLPPDFSPVKGARYLLQINLNTFPKGTVITLHSPYPDFNSLWSTITDTSLSIDPHAALKEAQAAMEKDL